MPSPTVALETTQVFVSIDQSTIDVVGVAMQGPEGPPGSDGVTYLNNLQGSVVIQANGNIVVTVDGHDILIQATPSGTSGQIQINNNGVFEGLTIGGDASFNVSTGALTVTKTNGVAFAPSATTDTTNAANIISGVFASARLNGNYSGITGVGTITSGTWSGLFGAVSGANLTNLTAANISAGTAGINITGNAANITATSNFTLSSLPNLSLNYSQLTGTPPTWNQNTTGTASNITGVSNSTLVTLSALSLPYSQITGAPSLTGYVPYSGATANLNLGSYSITASNFSGSSSGTNTGDQTNITGNAGTATKLQTARTLAGNSFDGSANIAFANKFIVQGTADAGLTGAQFLGSLSTGLLKNIGTTGVLTTAVAGTDYQAPISLTTNGTGVATLASNVLNIPDALSVANNLSDLNNAVTAVTNLGSGLNGLGYQSSINASNDAMWIYSATAAASKKIAIGDIFKLIDQLSSKGTATLADELVINDAASSFAPKKILVSALPFQGTLTLTTINTSGAATLVGNTLNIPQYAGATYTAGTGLTLTGGAFSVNTSQNILTLSNLTTNGLVKTQSGTGNLAIATAGTDYLAPFSSQTANTFYAAPNGGAGVPSFRAIVPGDIPTLNQNTTGSAATVGTILNLISAGSNVTITGSGTIASPYVIGATGGGTSAFSGITSGTNTSAAMLVGTGATLGVTGSGTIAATSVPASGLTGATLASGVTASSLQALGVQASALNMGSHQINFVTDPTSAQDAATKNYVDLATAAIDSKAPVKCATTSALPSNTYNNGSAGVGATITINTPAVLVIDGYTPSLGDRILVQNESTAANNGIYTLTTLGTVSVQAVLTRTTDFNQPGDGINGASVFVLNGTVNGNNLFMCTTTGTITFGTTAINWFNFKGATYTADGTTLTLTGSTFSVNSTYAATLATLTGTQTLTNKTLTSPTLTTPVLGTPASGTLTNCTGYTYANLAGTVPTWNQNTTGNAATVTTNANMSGVVTSVGNTTSFGSFTSATLASALSDETGTGFVVFSTSPSLTTPILGTPTSGNLTNCTGYTYANLAGTVPTWNQNTTGTAANITATTNSTLTTLSALSLPYSQLTGAPSLSGYVPYTGATSALNLGSYGLTAASLTSGGTITFSGLSVAGTVMNNASGVLSTTPNTGTGNNVLATSPTLVTPILGTPTSGTLTNCTGYTYANLAGTVPTWNQNTTGNAATVTTNANLTGVVTSVGNATSFGSFASSVLGTALTDKTGAGFAVFSASPALTGTPTAPTATAGTNTTQIASTAFVTTAVSAVGSTTAVKQDFAAGTGFTAGTSTTLTLTNTPLPTTASSIQVFFDGVAQFSNQWSFSTPTITFTSAIPSSISNIEVIWGATNAGTPTINQYANRLRNGFMNVNQRVSGTITAGTPAYSLDGYLISATGGNPSWAQSSGPIALPNGGQARSGLKITGATGITALSITHRIESYDASILAGQVCTFQATITNNTGASITPTLTTAYPTVQDNWTSQTTDLATVNLQPIANGATVTVAYAFTANTNATAGYAPILNFGTALNSTSNNIVITACDLRATPNNVSVGLISSPPTTEALEFTQDLEWCQRFFEKSYSQSAALGSSFTAGTQGPWLGTGVSQGYQAGFVPFAAVKRATPTVTTYDDGGTVGKCSYTTGTWTNGGTLGTTIISDHLLQFQFSTTCYLFHVNWAASAEL